MKRTIPLLLAALLSVPVQAAEAADATKPVRDSAYYPISVEEYTAGDFDEVGVDTKPHVQTVTLPSDTNNMEKILQTLDAEIEATTEDGYTGTLHLDHTTVKVTTDGYATKTGTVSATRTYPNLSDADLSLVPKTISDGGRSLTLADVQWGNSTQEEGDGVVTRYTATARYTGSTSSKYATGYTVTADYSGEVSKTGCNVVTYTAVFGSTDAPKDSGAQDGEPVDVSGIKRPLIIGGAVLALALGGAFVYKKIRRR